MKQTVFHRRGPHTGRKRVPPNAPLQSKDVENNMRSSLRKQNYLKRETNHMQSTEALEEVGRRTAF